MGNYGTHINPSVRNWFTRHSRFQVRFIPTSAFSISQVARWFTKLTEKQIRRGTSSSREERQNRAVQRIGGCDGRFLRIEMIRALPQKSIRIFLNMSR